MEQMERILKQFY